MPCNFAHSPKFFDDDREVFAQTPLQRLTELYTDRVTAIIREHGRSAKPFFLYYAHNYPHTPYKAGAAFRKHSDDGVRGDVIEELDWSVGQMMKALKETGLHENTIVIFTSDNGPTANQYAKPFRGTKYVSFEGGHRVPFIFSAPGWVSKPSVINQPINAMDVFPTLSSAIGAELPKDRIYDGVSLLPLTLGMGFSRPDQAPFYYYNCENLQAIRRGDWKLHLPRTRRQVPFWDKNKDFAGLSKPILYNLARDSREQHNVAAEHPMVVKELMKQAATVRNELGEFMKRGDQQRPTGSVVPGARVISHPRDFPTLDAETLQRIDSERRRRHPSRIQTKPRTRKAQQQ
jgi:arylsulfatase A-like enzyme